MTEEIAQQTNASLTELTKKQILKLWQWSCRPIIDLGDGIQVYDLSKFFQFAQITEKQTLAIMRWFEHTQPPFDIDKLP